MMLSLLGIFFSIFASVSAINLISLSRIDNTFKNIDGSMISSCVYNNSIFGYVYDKSKLINTVKSYLTLNLKNYVNEMSLSFTFYSNDKEVTIVNNRTGVTIGMKCSLSLTSYKKSVTYYIGEY